VPALDEGTPLFVQIAEQLADDSVADVLAEGARAPSTNELAAFYRINPATAAKGIILLVDGPSWRSAAASACSSPLALGNSCAPGAASSSPSSTSIPCWPKPAGWASTRTRWCP